jgi:hypothetical protein
MFPWNPNQWTEEYLKSLIGQSESGRLEFKSGKALARREDKDKFIESKLSRAVSTFANSEGGFLVIGIAEDKKGKTRVAGNLDGIAIGTGQAIESPEQFQQILDTCISPFLLGLDVRRVRLTGALEGRWALVIHVPQGSTAYQAKDHRYYSRSEFEAKAMPDHEIRLRMQRGRTPQARLELGIAKCLTAEQDYQNRVKTKADLLARSEAGELVLYGRAGYPSHDHLDAPKRSFDEYDFQLAVVNSGELTIRDFVLALRLARHDQHVRLVGAHCPEIGAEARFRFLRAAEKGVPNPTQEKKLFPEDRVHFPDYEWSLHVSSEAKLEPGKLLLDWIIYLDDAIPSKGVLDLGDALQRVAPTSNGGLEMEPCILGVKPNL